MTGPLVFAAVVVVLWIVAGVIVALLLGHMARQTEED